MKHFFFFLFYFISPFAYSEDNISLSTEKVPLQLENFPERPAPILEIGNKFLETGHLNKGIEIPTGAVWQPTFMMWGDFRTAIQSIDSNVKRGNTRLSEWSNRFDLFGNLSLSATERILVGLRPLDQDARFTRYTFESPRGSDIKEHSFEDEANLDLTTIFFEGDFKEIFPFVDKNNRYGLDIGFAVGRQQITWQDGMLINDRIDSLGLSKINIKNPWYVNHRSTLLWGWNELNRNVLAEDDRKSSLFGFSNEIDFRETTAEFDVIFVDGSEITGDGWYGGLGFTQRIFDFNSTFRVLTSHATGGDTIHNQDGTLFFTELSKDVGSSHDFIYLNGFCGIDQFRSASRAPEFGGPLGATGVLFAALGLGNYGAPLSNQTDNACGSALGYQIFFNSKRQHLLFEVGERYSYESLGQRATATGMSFQTAIGQRNILRFDTYGRYGKARSEYSNAENSDFSIGLRMEWVVRL